MPRMIRLALLALTIALAGTHVQAQDTPRTITVNGHGEVTVTPDMATVRLAVRAEAKTTGAALDEASLAIRAVLDLLSDQGVARVDIQTGALRLSPVHGEELVSGAPKITGYRAVNTVSVTVTDLDRLGGLIASAVNAGANTLSGVRFGLQDPRTHEDAARRKAVDDAHRRAALYAEAGDVPLGDMLRLNEQGTGGYSPLRGGPAMMEADPAAARADVPLAPGEITLSASVVVTYAIRSAG